MAQKYTNDAATFVIPGGYSRWTAANSNTGLSTTGVLAIIGESDAGPDYTMEADLRTNNFGPASEADVVAKYKSGNIVEAFKAAVAASNDAGIQGSFTSAIIVKTNASTQASTNLGMVGGGTYGTLTDKTYGKLGNLITVSVATKTAEVVPSTGDIVLLPPIASTNISLRANGGAIVTATLGAQATPATMKTTINGLTDIAATGGVDRAVLGTSGAPLSGNLGITAVLGNTITIGFSIAFGTIPSAGDILWIPAASVLATADPYTSKRNAGSYVVTGASAYAITAVKLLDVTGAMDALSAPYLVTPTSSVVNTNVLVYSPVVISLEAVNSINGVGKTLEINELTTGAGLLSNVAFTYTSSTGAAVSTWISKAGSPVVINSATERTISLTEARQVDNTSQVISVTSPTALLLSFTGTTAAVTIDSKLLTIAVTGGPSPAPIAISDFPTIADLATYINTLSGFSAAVGTAVLGQNATSTLDRGTFTFGTTFGGFTGRIKQDAYRFLSAINDTAVLIHLKARADKGLPDYQALTFLTGGAKGATLATDAVLPSITGAFDAIEAIRCNFVVPLFSRDAVLDIADGLTDISSTYTIGGIQSYGRAHVLSMSTMKRRRPRQAIFSIRDTFANAQTAAANLASYRCCMVFQDVKDAPLGTVKQYQPWMAAVKAAAMQAAGFYRPIVHKYIAISGALQAAGDYKDANDDYVEGALLSGLMPIATDDQAGGYYWVSDQTTYGKDDNFIYNSLQGTYVSDIVAATTAYRMEVSFVGQSLADVSASSAAVAIGQIMGEMKRLKLLAASDDAPLGYKNVQVKLVNGNALQVSLEIKVAGAIYFVPISFSVTQVQQSA